MINRIVNKLNQLSFTNSLVRVPQIFINKQEKSQIRLENNYLFQHACMTPLTVLSCSLESLELSLVSRNDEIIAENISTLKQATKRLTELIFSITKSQDVNLSFNVYKTINEVIILFNKRHGAEINYLFNDKHNLHLKGNKLYFQEILVCLLSNACEAYLDKTQVYVSLVVRKKKNNLVINIVDYASGMSLIAQKIALIQGISYKEKGLGLGLFFTKKTIESEFDGQMIINSRLGMGTHIQITIPLD